MEQVQELLDTGEVMNETLCWTEGMDNRELWVECKHQFALVGSEGGHVDRLG
jgi:hypothetical protein